MATTDFLVIGGGVIGISIARQLRRAYGDASVTVLEKELACGLHASGRNSGVLHAGFYYAADSLKARFTRRGNAMLTEYCADRRLPLEMDFVVEGDDRSMHVLNAVSPGFTCALPFAAAVCERIVAAIGPASRVETAAAALGTS